MAELLLCASQRNNGSQLATISCKRLALLHQWDNKRFLYSDEIARFLSIPIFFLSFSVCCS